MNTYRQIMERHLQVLSSDHKAHELDEQAVPSYTHQNRLMAWLFWQRLSVVMRYLEKQTLGCVLDFGCGTGVLFPFLIPRSKLLLGFDINLQASQFTIERLGLHNVVLLNPQSGLSSLKPGSIDTIIALDVLEHVSDLNKTIRTFEHLLSSQGQLIISGPTESLFYRIGRRLAGYKQHFHVRTIYDIEQHIARYMDVRVIAQLYPPVTLFRISVARKRVG